LGNLINQCHVHVIPRYKESREFEGAKFTDGRWGKNHSPYDKGFFVPEETLQKIAARIKKELG
jgi:diadenosine tetraphosphate (Ap4A) HIT family hydrolase